MIRLLILFGLLMEVAISTKAETIVDFEELNVFNGQPPSGVGEYFDGYGAGANTAGFVSKGVAFQTGQFGPGFSYSNAQDTTSPGFMNQFAAFPGGGAGTGGGTVIGANYAIVNTGSDVLSDGTPTNGANLNFGQAVNPVSIDVANTTYAMLYLRDGRFTDFGGNIVNDPNSQFTDNDFFLLRITGFDADDGTGNVTGTMDYSLADYGGPGTGDDVRLETWDRIDLSGFSTTRSLTFQTTASQIANFGLFFHDVPAYAAIDNLTFAVAIPEPSSVLALLLGSAIFVARRSRRSTREL